MKYPLLFCLFVLLSASRTQAQTSGGISAELDLAEPVETVMSDDSKVRRGPGLFSKVRGNVKRGDAITVTRLHSDKLYIESRDVSGWVGRDRVERTPLLNELIEEAEGIAREQQFAQEQQQLRERLAREEKARSTRRGWNMEVFGEAGAKVDMEIELGSGITVQTVTLPWNGPIAQRVGEPVKVTVKTGDHGGVVHLEFRINGNIVSAMQVQGVNTAGSLAY